MRILILISILFVFSACSGQDDQVIQLAGKLGKNLEATIELTPHGKAFEGSFRYAGKPEAISLSGYLNGNILTLQEYNNPEFPDQITGTFTGLFSTDKFEGTWSDPSNKSAVPFLFIKSEHNSPTYNKNTSEVSVDYIVEDMSDEWLDQHFYGIVNGNKSKLLGGINDGECFFLDTLIDLNLDGQLEAIVAKSEACGGNCCPNDYVLAFYSKQEQKFKLAGLGTSWSSPSFSVEDGQLIISSYYESAGINVDAMDAYSSKQFFDGEQIIETEFRQQQAIPAIWEITAEDIVGENEDKTSFRYDLNNDGLKEEIIISYWSRWALLTPSLMLESSQPIEFPQTKRFGVLADRTNGYSDIVIGYDYVFRWDGETYVPKD